MLIFRIAPNLREFSVRQMKGWILIVLPFP